jgi:hypothetical protein
MAVRLLKNPVRRWRRRRTDRNLPGMAFRTWVRLLLATVGVGALTAAGQLGVAYGLGVLRLTGVLDQTTRDEWTAQLAWAAWLPAVAAVAGAAAGARLLTRWRPPGVHPGAGSALALALAGALGAAVVAPLTMQPARTAHVEGVHPVLVIGVCAGLGAAVGVFAGFAAAVHRTVRWNVAALATAVWLAAIASVTLPLSAGGPAGTVRLGVPDATVLPRELAQRAALVTMPALALLAGAAVGWAARRRGAGTMAIALAGLPGPALLTLAYLIAGPGTGDAHDQVLPYWGAMVATGAGVLGSVLAAVLRRGLDRDDPQGLPPAPGPTAAARTPPAGLAGRQPQPPGSPLPGTAAPGPAAVPGGRPPAPHPGPDAPPPTAPAREPGPGAAGPGAARPDAAPPGAVARRAGFGRVAAAVGARVRTGGPRAAAGPGPARHGVVPAAAQAAPDRAAAGPAQGKGVRPGPGQSALHGPNPATMRRDGRGPGRPGQIAQAGPGRPADPADLGERPAGRRPNGADTAANRSGIWPLRRAAGAPPAPAYRPYVPEPATRPLPPEVLGHPVAAPDAAQPGGQRRPGSGPEAPAPAVPDRGRKGVKKGRDADYVDWVSGLGGD